MIFRTLFVTQALSKKVAITGLGATVVGSTIHWGVYKPLANYQNSMHVEGSQPLLRNKRGDPYLRDKGEPFLVKHLDKTKRTPSTFPALTRNHLLNKVSAAFDSSIKHTISQTPEKIRMVYQSEKLKRNDDIEQSVLPLEEVDDSLPRISIVEIPFKSKYYNDLISSLSKEQLIYDLIWSLADESADERTVIRPSSIKVDLSIEKRRTDSDSLKSFPIPANKIKNLKIEFVVYNPNARPKNVFKSIEIHPYQEAKVTVNLTQGELRPYAVSVKAATQNLIKWGINPVNNGKFEVTIEEKFPKKTTSVLQEPNLSLIYNRSQFSPDIDHQEIYMINSPTYSDFHKAVSPLFLGITAEDVKKDIEVWYGKWAAHRVKLSIEDIARLIDVLQVKLFYDKETGSKLSVIEELVKRPKMRQSLYQYVQFDRSSSKVLDNIFDATDNDQKNNTTPLTVDEVDAFVNSAAWALTQIKENMSVEFEWIQEPTLSGSDDTFKTPYPTVSFEFKQTIKFGKKATLPFQGCWKKDQKEFSEATDKTNCQGGKYFNLSKQLDRFSDIINPVKAMFGETAAGFLTEPIIGDAVPFVSWKDFEVQANDHVVQTFKASNSPIQPSFSGSQDYWDSRLVVPGWKALDVSCAVDFSKFTHFFYKLYEKADKFKNTDCSLANFSSEGGIACWGDWTKVGEIAKNQPFTLVAHLINNLFDKKYYEKDSQTQNPPWKTFFENLFKNPLKVDSDQLFVGFSSKILDVEQFLYTQEASSKTPSTKQTFKVNENIFKDHDSTSVGLFPGKYKNESISKILSNTTLNYSTYFPKAPMMMDVSVKSNPEWQKFLEGEGSTSAGFIAYSDKLKDIFIKVFHTRPVDVLGDDKGNNNDGKEHNYAWFPDKGLINWANVKISVTPLDIESAFKSVLQLPNSIGKLAGSKIKIPELLGSYIQRNIMGITVNMMNEDNALSAMKNPVKWFSRSVYSTYKFMVSPNLDTTKLGSSAQFIIKLAKGETSVR